MNSQFKVADKMVLTLALVLSALGLFFAFDAGYARSIGAGHGVIPPEFFSQFEGLVVGLAVAGCLIFSNRNQVEKYAKGFWFVCVGLLLATAYSPLRLVRSGAARWIHIGPILIQGA